VYLLVQSLQAATAGVAKGAPHHHRLRVLFVPKDNIPRVLETPILSVSTDTQQQAAKPVIAASSN
jgi:hypothetical protein